MSEFVIEKGIPLPSAPLPGRQGGLAAALRSMSVGDSISCGSRVRNNVAAQARAVAHQEGDGRAYATRVIDGVVRVWRVK